eukprot:15120943-Alexandrium_andersonii.AAC.1
MHARVYAIQQTSKQARMQSCSNAYMPRNTNAGRLMLTTCLDKRRPPQTALGGLAVCGFMQC